VAATKVVAVSIAFVGTLAELSVRHTRGRVAAAVAAAETDDNNEAIEPSAVQ